MNFQFKDVPLRSTTYTRVMKKCKRLNMLYGGYNELFSRAEYKEIYPHGKRKISYMSYGTRRIKDIRFPDTMERDLFIKEYNDGYIRMVRGKEKV